MLWVAVAWSLFQLWYASPLPFVFGFGILNDTEARAIHLGFALFLTFLAYPALRSSPRDRVPLLDWVLAAVGGFAGAYLFLFYVQLSGRPGQPTTLDLVTGTVGILLLLEATRRALGLPMVVVACVFIFYTFAGQYMPDVIQHRGASLNKFLNHQWLTTEGVFGIALGVSTSFVFLFVLFGTLLERAGAGNWMMQISIALLGHLRGGPAKVAVVSSALNGVVSGSSVSNVVSGGIFTIPLMKRTGLSGVKAGAIEASASINGQIMPPVMGAAAFLMVEYVGIPYSEIVKHALLPAVFSYLALLYMVHLEAIKVGLKTIPQRPTPARERMLRMGLGLSGSVLAVCIVYYGIVAIQAVFGGAAPPVLAIAGAALYVASVWYSSRYPDLALDDPNAPILELPRAWDVTRTGLDFLIPIAVLLWCLMVEQMSPGLSAFWATLSILGIVATRKPLMAIFRNENLMASLRAAWDDLIEGLALGARNMIGIGIATATAGIVVGTITLTGLGLMMTELVEFISGGNVILMLILIAAISLVLGMGIPTTANYILVATLMAPVVVDLGAQAGLPIPLIAVHLFVFYFGIMADITPPVGLAAFAAAAISKEDPIATGFQGALYSLRTAILPFVFIFNPAILLIGVDTWPQTIWVATVSLIAILLFSAATMNWFVTKSRLWESAALLLICFTLFRPDWWLNQVSPPYQELPASEFLSAVGQTPADGRINFVVEGVDLMGEDVRKTVNVPLGEPGEPLKRLRDIGLTITQAGDALMISNVAFGSYAKRIGLEVGYDVVAVLRKADQPSSLIPIGLALAATAGVAGLQFARARKQADRKETGPAR
ncbi:MULTISPECIES: TRAP transporter permease [unclassified Mesorhizobium]|uniref:TRAP transporter permease n=1 Tax=unclassified Mesorhizobium TaxID=325217 RepID=UPI000FE9651D|nr:MULTISPECIES: TRAP transporter permease [unclassified Mesorhizobium]RWC24545.1 MAG: TRAP transporter fused permease subunit [Mesorhizobium sp.]RWD48116.1 MAG: TRAP transporter fused permease subunit [Mesorhizobium sp.]TGT94940.1 TRAP transporter fused permease subunit [Mesorhizobium sp. M5C.F.Ca.ET.164.01.1.1]